MQNCFYDIHQFFYFCWLNVAVPKWWICLYWMVLGKLKIPRESRPSIRHESSFWASVILWSFQLEKVYFPQFKFKKPTFCATNTNFNRTCGLLKLFETYMNNTCLVLPTVPPIFIPPPFPLPPINQLRRGFTFEFCKGKINLRLHLYFQVLSFSWHFVWFYPSLPFPSYCPPLASFPLPPPNLPRF